MTNSQRIFLEYIGYLHGLQKEGSISKESFGDLALWAARFWVLGVRAELTPEDIAWADRAIDGIAYKRGVEGLGD